RLEPSGSGTYFNASQGAFAQVSLTPPATSGDVWAGRDSQTWQVSDAYGNPGSFPGWDQTNITGTLDVTATPANRFTVKIVSLGRDVKPGVPSNFENNTYFTWPILSATGSILNFDPAKVDLDTEAFQGDLGGGTFSLSLSGDGMGVDLNFI